MLNIRRSEDRGVGEHGWLSSRHTFSFAGYYDPKFTGYRDLLVINEDHVAAGRGFGTHGHRDMEIISYVLDGALEHADSMGTGSVIRPGDVQRMTAGTGVYHSEYNHSKHDQVHFLQIWIQPSQTALRPSYEQKTFSDDEKRGRFRLVASPDGAEGSVTIHQDVRLYASLIEEGQELTFERSEGRHLWLHVAKGAVEVNCERLEAGDAVSTEAESRGEGKDPSELRLNGLETSEVLLFDLA
ncbi:MAG: pirin family protein [Myxococcota bacterium]